MEQGKKEKALWNIKEMIDYAQEIYPNVKKNINECLMDKSTIEKQIKRTIDKYLYPEGSTDDSANEKDRKKPQGKYSLSPDLAKIFIEYIMNDYFLSEKPWLEERNKTKRQKQIDENQRKGMEIIEKQSVREDEKFNQAIMEQLGEYHLAEYDDEITWSAPLTEGCTLDDETTWVSDGSYYYENTPDLNVYDYTYHIPKEPSYSSEFADKVIDRMMIRAIFDYLFDFKEEKFRRDLEERSKLIDTMEPLQVHPGFTKLTKKLENPLKNYISLKDIHKKQ